MFINMRQACDIGKLEKVLILLQNDHFQCYSLKHFREHVYYWYISAKFVKNKKNCSIAEKDKKVALLQFYLLFAEWH